MTFAFRAQREELFEILVDTTLDINDITAFTNQFFDGNSKPTGRDSCLHCTRLVHPNNSRAVRLFDQELQEYFTFYLHENCAKKLVNTAIKEGNRRYTEQPTS